MLSTLSRCALLQIVLFVVILPLSKGCRLCTKTILQHRYHTQNMMISFVRTPIESNEKEPSDILSGFMKGSINWYKEYISPSLPPRCRFLPSCSSYGLEAIDKYGAVKGGILTAWRILRCNPFGGSGYDPPIWPPPGYFAGSTSKRS